MKGGIWKHNRTYIAIWIHSVSTLTGMMSQSRTNQIPDESYKHALEVEDQLSELLETRGATVPPASELLGTVEEIEKRQKVAEGKKTDWADDEEPDDVDLLVKDETTPLAAMGEFKDAGKLHPFVLPPQPPLIEAREAEDEDNDYEESFASQKEISQLREEFEVMSDRMNKYEDVIEALLKERENLPVQITAIREDINGQMTLALDKLHSALESDKSPLNVHAAASAVKDVRDISVDRLESASSYLKSAPNKSSPVANAGVELKGKRRYRPVK